MTNPFMNQWIAMGQDTLKKITEAQQNGFSNLTQAQPFDMGSAAEAMKTSVKSLQDVSNQSSDIMNRMISNQATSLKLNVSADAMTNLTEIVGVSINQAIQQQTKLASECMKPLANFLTGLSEVRKTEDLIGLQTAFSRDIEAALKGNAEENAALLGSVRSAVSSWTENTLDSVADSKTDNS
jgi:hypothetical protein